MVLFELYNRPQGKKYFLGRPNEQLLLRVGETVSAADVNNKRPDLKILTFFTGVTQFHAYRETNRDPVTLSIMGEMENGVTLKNRKGLEIAQADFLLFLGNNRSITIQENDRSGTTPTPWNQLGAYRLRIKTEG
jgi:hypothetical protein